MSSAVCPSKARIRRLMMPLVITASLSARKWRRCSSSLWQAFGLVFLVDDGTFAAEVYNIGVFVEPILECRELVDNLFFNFLYGHLEN